MDASQFAIELARVAADSKSEDVIAFDLRGISSVMDYCVICTGTSDRQMRAVADQMIDYGRKVGQKAYGVAGYEHGAWVLVDFVDVVVHLFARSYREYYDLELLWGDAPRMAWQRSESA
ncbi:MAG: ribosome silencing factor [Phycisphaerales bacterium]|nr:MAG: ribosome silencing factor [Phycisphaerales bacterium]